MCQTCVFVKPEHDVHVLYSLSGRAFDQIVNYRQDNPQILIGCFLNADSADVAASDTPCFGKMSGRQNIDKGAVLIKITQYFFGLAAVFQVQVERGVHAAYHRRQVRYEDEAV